ncbi:piggybac transposable element-derived protein 4 [Holotrichia oblita]|uniref:Piggybac transposable element-derived protein 4 n=1 Tax=Holotrichia oblita TaxID=644536 RepID=A0ACB9SK68_HOLOL|nr:piggybac transposable element-derived protein 4 [Holotrichia oblita]
MGGWSDAEPRPTWCNNGSRSPCMHPTLLEDPHIDGRATFAWLTRGDLYAESEGFIFSMQDQVVATKSYRKHILKDPNMPNAKCRVCGQKDETIDHLMGSCTVLAPKEYTD